VAVLDGDMHVAEGAVRAYCHAMAAFQTGFFPTGNHFRIAFIVFDLDDDHGTFFYTSTVFFAFTLIND
jgi:hypothetical protein